MIFLARLHESGGLHRAQVDRFAQRAQFAGLDQLVVAVQIAQILLVPLGGQIGDIAVPVQQVEGRVILPQQVIVGDVVPDQIGAAQHVEGGGQIAPVDHALLRQVGERIQLHVVDEDLELARLLEIHLRGEEGGGGDLVGLPLGRHHRQRGGQRGSGDAIADRVDLFHVQPLAHRVDRVDLGGDVIVPRHVRHIGVGALPADHEHADPLVQRPAHETLFLVQVEDVEPVDPGREDHQRHFQHGFRRGGILDQFVQVGLVNHLAGRGRQVFAQREGGCIDMGQLAARHVGHQVFHALRQALSVRLCHPVQHQRIGEREMIGAERFQRGAGGEPQPIALGLVGYVDLLDQRAQLLGNQQVGLVHQCEDRIGAPLGIGEAAVLPRQVGGVDALVRTARRADAVGLADRVPQLQGFGPQLALDLRGTARQLLPPILEGGGPARRVHAFHRGEFTGLRHGRQLLFPHLGGLRRHRLPVRERIARPVAGAARLRQKGQAAVHHLLRRLGLPFHQPGDRVGREGEGFEGRVARIGSHANGCSRLRPLAKHLRAPPP